MILRNSDRLLANSDEIEINTKLFEDRYCAMLRAQHKGYRSTQGSIERKDVRD